MGILDVIRGMQNGPRGATNPSASGGPSTATMALLALLAYKAWKSYSANGNAAAPGGTAPNSGGLGGGLGGLLGGLFGGQAGRPGVNPGGMGGGMGGGLGGAMGGGLGGLGSALGGGMLGGLLGEGLRKLVGDMQSNGMGDYAQSWVGTGPNQSINQNDLAKAIGSDDLDQLVQQTGMSRDQLLSELQSQLPDAVDELTPGGHIPSQDEYSRMI